MLDQICERTIAISLSAKVGQQIVQTDIFQPVRRSDPYLGVGVPVDVKIGKQHVHESIVLITKNTH